MDEQDQEQMGKRARRFWSDWWGLIVISLILLVLILVPAVLVWTGRLRPGFGEIRETVQAGEYFRPERTLWDWMELILVPVVLAAGAALFTWLNDKRRQESEAQQARLQWETELDRSREDALQKYLDTMTDLLKDGLHESEPDDVKRSIARARTVTVLRQLDGRRKAWLLEFLCASNLIGVALDAEQEEEPIVNLRGANLGGAKLATAELNGVCLYNVFLRGADLRWAKLIGADLRYAKLDKADLRHARLDKADLRWADLDGADLRWAKLNDAQITEKKLAQAASLEGATLPDGMVHE